MSVLHMTLGPNIGRILLEISQTCIQDGYPEKAVKTYTDSLNGFTEDYVLELLRNNYVLTTADDKVSVELTNSEAERSSNEKNITDWTFWLKKRLEDMSETVKASNGIRHEFNKHISGSILDYNITKPVVDYFGEELAKNVGIHNIAAKLIAGYKFANLHSNGENVWNELCIKVENGDGEKYQEALYFIVKYVDNIRNLYKEYMQFVPSCAFLLANKLAERPVLFESRIESILDKLTEFANTSIGYYHPLCNERLRKFKEKMHNAILSADFNKEFNKYGIIAKNIMDGYDAGWLSPEGKFYGENGSTSSFIHLRLAEKLRPNVDNCDYELEKEGWIKIHGNEVYGAFGVAFDNYCPTDVQIKLICAYIDKFYEGKLYTRPQIVETTPTISTHKLMQMDKVKLHEIFSI